MNRRPSSISPQKSATFASNEPPRHLLLDLPLSQKSPPPSYTDGDGDILSLLFAARSSCVWIRRRPVLAQLGALDPKLDDELFRVRPARPVQRRVPRLKLGARVRRRWAAGAVQPTHPDPRGRCAVPRREERLPPCVLPTRTSSDGALRRGPPPQLGKVMLHFQGDKIWHDR